jgi:hypothetical protein
VRNIFLESTVHTVEISQKVLKVVKMSYKSWYMHKMFYVITTDINCC